MQKVRIGLAGLVTTVWLVGYGLAYASGKQSPTELTGLMAVVLGWAFAGSIKDTIQARTAKPKEKDDA